MGVRKVQQLSNVQKPQNTDGSEVQSRAMRRKSRSTGRPDRVDSTSKFTRFSIENMCTSFFRSVELSIPSIRTWNCDIDFPTSCYKGKPCRAANWKESIHNKSCWSQLFGIFSFDGLRTYGFETVGVSHVIVSKFYATEVVWFLKVLLWLLHLMLDFSLLALYVNTDVVSLWYTHVRPTLYDTYSTHRLNSKI